MRRPSGACAIPKRTIENVGVPGDVTPGKMDAAGACLRPTANRHEQGGFAGAIRADECDDLAFRDLEVDALQRLDIAVEGVDLRDRQEAHRRAPPSSS